MWLNPLLISCDIGPGMALRGRGVEHPPHSAKLSAVKDAQAALKPGDLERKVHIMDRDATVDGMYLRIISHDNEHMGQLVAYARMTGVVPPWSKE